MTATTEMVYFDETTAWWVHECEVHKRRLTFTRERNARDCDVGHQHYGHSVKMNQVPSEWLKRHWELTRLAKHR